MQFHGPDEVFYLEGSAWITENDSSNITGGTFGIGNRWMIRDFSQVIGINAFAAWDQTNTGNTYDGAGIGVEWFTDYLSVTANGYIPWGNENINALGPETPDKDSAFFQGTNLAFMAFQPVEEQTAGVDVEVGSTIPRAEFLSAYVGGYHFDAEEGNEFSGVSGRIQMDMTNAIVNLTVSNDDRFGTTVNLGGEIRLGDGPLNFAPRSRNLDRKMFDRARRRSRISTTTYDAETVVIATRPDDGSPHAGLPFEFLHVDNDLGSLGGDGSFDDRFFDLNQASNMPDADIILVYRGNSSFGADQVNANGGLFLEDNQIVVGEGYADFTIVTAQFPGQACPLPGFGDGGMNPFINSTNDNANLINLANNNRILGLNLLPSQTGAAPINVGNAIFGEDITITSSASVPFIDQVNKDIDLTVASTGSGGGIRLENAAGTAFITDSGFNIDNTDASGGVVVENTNAADLNISVINDLTTFPDLVYNGGTAGVSISGDGSLVNATLMGVNSSNSLNGLEQVSTNGGNVNITSTGNNFTEAVEDNFNAMIDGGTGTATLDQTSLADAGQDAVDIFADNGGTFTLTLDDSSGDGADQNGILAMIDGGSNVTLTATDSTFDDALNGSGIDVTVLDGSIFTGSVTDGSFDDAGMNAIGLDVQDAGSNGSLTLVNTSGQRAGEDAININAVDTAAVNNAVANIVLADSTMFDTATDDGLQITNDGATVNVFANSTPDSIVDFSNFVNGSGLNSVSTGSGAATNLTFTDGASFDNMLANIAGDAIFIQSDDGANTTLTGSAISGENAGDDGIDLNSDGGMITVDISAAGSFAEAGQNDATGDGIDILNDNGGVILLDLDTAAGIADFSGAARNGLLSASGDTMGVGGTLTTVNFNDGADLSDAGFDAIGISSVAGADTNVTGRSMVGTMAGSDAIQLFATGTDSMIDIDFTGTNDFSDALTSGITSFNTAGGNIDVNIGNADFSETVIGSGRLTGDGLASGANGAGTSSTFTFNTGAMFNNAGIAAILLDTSDGASNTVQGADLSGTMAGADAIEIVNTGVADSTTTINLTGTNDFSDAGNNGINSMNTAGDVIVSIGDADFSGNGVTPLGGSGITSTATGATADSMFTFNTGANFDDSGINAIMLDSLAGGTNTFIGDTVSGANAGADAINLNADGTDSDITLTLTNSTDFTNSGEDGLDFTVSDGANTDINLSGVGGTPINFDDTDGMEAGFGVLGTVTDSSASLTLNNASFDQAASNGLLVIATNSEFNSNIANTTFNDSNATGVQFNLSNVTGNPIVLNNVEAMNAGQQTTNALANALELNIRDGGSNEFDIDNFNGDSAFNNGFEINVDDLGTGSSTLTFDLDNSSFAMAGRNAAEWNALNNSVIESAAGATFDTIDLSGAGQLGAAVTATDDGDALQINSMMMSRVGFDTGMLLTSDIKIDNSDLSGAAGSAMDFMLDGGSEVNVHVDPTDLTGAGGNGVEFDVLGGSLLNLQITDNSDISTAGTPVGENGILGIIDEASTVNLLVDDSQIMNDGALPGDFSAIDITTNDNSTLNLDLNNVDMSGWSDAGQTIGTGLLLDVTDSSTAVVNVLGAGTDISNAGVNAIDIFADGGSDVTLDLGTDGLVLDGAGNTGLLLVSEGTGTTINVDGDDVSASGTGNLGFDLQALDGGVIDLTGADNLGLDGWVADGNGTGGLDILADGVGSSVFGIINNLDTINNGVAGDDDSFGIRVRALGEAQIGARGAGSAGLMFNNATSGNFDAMGDPDFLNLVQDNALLVDVDDDAFAGLIFNDSQFDANEEDGAIIRTNVDDSATDEALASVLFSGGSISNNGGHGVLLISDEADVTTQATVGQSGGINARFQDIDINLNSDFFPQPVNPALIPDAGADGNDNGFGVFVEADGNMGGGPGLVNINFDNTDLANNEEGDFGDNGGTIINVSFNNMNLNTPIQICADGADMTQVFNDVTISGLTGDQAAISILAEAGFTADVTFNNVTIRDVEAQAIAMLARTGGNIVADFNGLTIDNAGYGMAGVTTDDPTKTGLALEGVIQGSFLAGSTGDINLAGVTIDNTDGMTDMGVMTTINVNAVDFEVDGVGAMLNLNIAPDAPLGGLTVLNGATTAGNEAGAPADEGEIDVQLTGGAQATINLGDINVDDSDSLGINLTDDDNAAGGFTITGLDDISANNAQAGGLNIEGNIIDNGMGGTPTEVNITNSNFNDAGQGAASDGINIDLDFTGDGALNLTNVNANNATNGGVDIRLTGDAGTTTLDVTLDTVNANDAMAGDGLEVNVEGLVTGANSDVVITGSSFNNAVGVLSDGIDINFGGAADATATVDVTMTNATGAGNDGFDLLSTLVDVTSVNLNTVDFSTAANRGANVDIGPQAVDAVVTIDNLTANDTGGDAVNVNLFTIDADTTTTLSNITANNTDPMTFTGGGIDINLVDTTDTINAGTQTIIIDNVSAQGAVGADGLDITVTGLDGDETLDLIIGNGSNFSGNGLGGVDINATGMAGTTINLDVDGVDANNNLGGDGFNFASNGEIININNLANLTSTGNALDGVDLTFDGGSVVTFDPMGNFDNLTAQMNQQSGLVIEVLGASTLTPVTFDGIDLSDNGLGGQGFDGLDIQVHEAMSSAEFTFNSLTINNSGGRGIDLDVFDGGDLTFTIDNTMGGGIDSSGRQGLDIDVGAFDEDPAMAATPMGTGTFTGNFMGLDITNSGQFPTTTSDGVNVLVTGVGSTADITFDDVSSNNSDEDGFDIDINGGAVATVNVQNGTEAMNNMTGAGTNVGLSFTADDTGALGTTASLVMDGSMAANNFSNNEDEGILIELTNGVTAPVIQIDAVATGNGADGIRIEANDNTGTTITMLNINNAQADNNMGNGLFVDLFGVSGIDDIDFSNATFSGNQGDQVFFGLREQDLTNFNVQDVTVVGTAGSGDGLEINLVDSNITDTFSVTNLTATDNGERGLNLILDEADILNMTEESSINVGFITESEFARNGLAGARLQFGGDSTSDFDIYNNTVGFHDNTGIGLNVQIQDSATFTIEGDSVNAVDPMNPEQSFYNNTFANNGSFGVLFEASEPDDADPLDFDEPQGGNGPPGQLTFGPRYTLELGDSNRNPNVITGNQNAALAVIGSNDSIGSFEITNGILTTTGAMGTDARFNGDGLAFYLEDRAVLTSLDIDGSTSQLDLNDNAGSGLFTSINTNSMLGRDSRLSVTASTIMGNQMHGIDIQRDDNALYGPDVASTQIFIGGVTEAEGNALINNTLNGLNIDNDNANGEPPFDLQVRSNTFMGNQQDGIFARGTADAQFSGRFSDNIFTGQGDNGIRIVLENDAALGDSDLASNPGSDPFLMDGNQFMMNGFTNASGSGGNGIFFDTNFSNETGTFGGSAYVNVLIQDSETRTDAFALPVRTLISGNANNGVKIIDNSEYLGDMNSVTAQNTYDIRGTTITGNGVDGISVEQGERTLAGGPSGGAVRDANNGIALLLGRDLGTSPYVGKRDVVISLNGDDGIDLELRDGDNIANMFEMDLVSILDNGATGDNQRNEMGPQNVGHGLEIEIGEGNQNVNDQGRLIGVFNNVDVLRNFGDGMDFIVTTLRNGNVADIRMYDTNSSMNGGRGFDAYLRHDNRQTAGGNSTAFSTWRLGSGDLVNDLSLTNQFNSNDREGVVFDISARNIDPRDVQRGGTYPHRTHTDINNDIFVEDVGGNNTTSGSLHLPSTQHPGLTQGPLVDTTADIDGTGIHVNTFIQFVNSEAASNGGFGGFEDGLDVAVGALTRANVSIGNASFGGNRGDDIRIYPQESRLDDGTRIILPIGPTAGASSFNDPGNDGGHSYVIYDPVAYIDLAFGVVDSTGGWQVDTTAGNGEAATSATGGGGNGDQVTFLTFGTQQTSQITFDGIFNQTDLVKPNSRSVRLAGAVIGATPGTGMGDDIVGGSDDNTNNVFRLGAVVQDINAIFGPTGWITYAGFDPDGNGFFIDNTATGTNTVPGGQNPIGY